ncbi:MAG: hypothetical protein AAF587_19410 [Bacteroidota bacterium]
MLNTYGQTPPTPPPPIVAQLWGEFSDGDELAFGHLYERYRPYLDYRMRGEFKEGLEKKDIEDSIQTFFLKLYLTIKQVQLIELEALESPSLEDMQRAKALRQRIIGHPDLPEAEKKKRLQRMAKLKDKNKLMAHYRGLGRMDKKGKQTMLHHYILRGVKNQCLNEIGKRKKFNKSEEDITKGNIHVLKTDSLDDVDSYLAQAIEQIQNPLVKKVWNWLNLGYSFHEIGELLQDDFPQKTLAQRVKMARNAHDKGKIQLFNMLKTSREGRACLSRNREFFERFLPLRYRDLYESEKEDVQTLLEWTKKNTDSFKASMVAWIALDGEWDKVKEQFPDRTYQEIVHAATTGWAEFGKKLKAQNSWAKNRMNRFLIKLDI